jgi:hypothetical protein
MFFTSALAGGEWSASRSCHFTPAERAPGTHSVGGWVGPRAGVDDVEKRKLFYRDSNSDPSVVQPVASCYTDSAMLVPSILTLVKENHSMRSYSKKVLQSNPRAATFGCKIFIEISMRLNENCRIVWRENTFTFGRLRIEVRSLSVSVQLKSLTIWH